MGKGKRAADAPVEGEGASSNKRPKRIATLSEKDCIRKLKDILMTKRLRCPSIFGYNPLISLRC